MPELSQIYEIDKSDQLYCKFVRLVKGAHKIPKMLAKYSRKKYGMKDNVLRYFVHAYMGIKVGKFTYGFEGLCHRHKLESIGAFCSIASGVKITEGNHPTECITSSPVIYLREFGFLQHDNQDLINKHSTGKVVIGNDVWIGQNVTIFKKVKIGNGAVIGAGAVVTKDVPDYAIVVGVPAKVSRYRFESEVIESLNQIQWWNWPDDEIRKNIDLMSEPKYFINRLCKRE